MQRRSVTPRGNEERMKSDPTLPKDFVEKCAKLEAAHKVCPTSSCFPP